MKGGKADKSKRTSSSKPASKRAVANQSKGAARPANVAPRKGVRKRPDVGGGSSKGEE